MARGRRITLRSPSSRAIRALIKELVTQDDARSYRSNSLKRAVAVAAVAAFMSVLVAPAAAAEAAGSTIEATTSGGEKVLLHPNGRWEYVNAQKAAEARKVAEQYPENQGCPPGSQGAFFGF